MPSNIPDNVSVNDPEAPWNQAAPRMKKIKVSVRFSGVDTDTIEVPEDLDTEDPAAVADALEKYSYQHVKGGFWGLTIGEFFHETKRIGDNPTPWYDKDRAVVYVDDVEEI